MGNICHLFCRKSESRSKNNEPSTTAPEVLLVLQDFVLDEEESIRDGIIR